MGGKKQERQMEKAEREAEREKQRKQAEERKQQEAWMQEEAQSKADLKGGRKLAREQAAAERAEEERRKQEAKRQAKAEEDAELERIGKGGKLKSDKPQKVTQAEREKYRQEQKAKLEALSEEKRQELQHTIGVEEYQKLLDSYVNTNREQSDVEASSLSNALEQLDLVHKSEHKMTFKEYAEQELPNLKEEKPGLRKSQYNDLLFKRWQRSPLNPKNQQQQAAASVADE